jgi:multiple sugar transport system permease protein
MAAVDRAIQPTQEQVIAHRGRLGPVLNKFYPYLYVLPFLLFFIVFQIYPIFYGLYVSLTRWDLTSAPEFVGLANYINIIGRDSLFWTSLRNTILFVSLNAPLVVLIPLGLALLVNDSIPGRTLFRSAFITPLIISVSSVGVLWVWFFNPALGLINHYLELLGLQGQNWLASSPWAMVAVVVASVWWTSGFNTILFLAGIQDIPDHLYDAAKIDGAGNWALFRHITIPGLRTTILFVAVTTIIGSFRVFPIVLVMTNGGPYDSTRTLVMHIYESAFRFFRMGSASTIAWLLFAIVIVFTVIQFRMLRNQE